MLSPEERREIEEELTRYPDPRAACIDALKIVQRHRGWVSEQGLRDVAEFFQMTPDELDGVATFYNLLYRRPVGRHVILLCDSISCWIMGLDRLQARFAELGLKYGETTPDKRFTLLPVPCLGACDRAPVLLLDEDLHLDLSPEAIQPILDRYP